MSVRDSAKKTQGVEMAPEHTHLDHARAILCVRRDPYDPESRWGDVEEFPLPMGAAQIAEGRRGAASPWEIRQRETSRQREPMYLRYEQPSDRSVCLRPGATVRDEERAAPRLLDRYRFLQRNAPASTDTASIRRHIQKTFAAIDRGDFRAILRGGLARLYKAFAPWIENPMIRAVIEGDPCDREFRRKRAAKARREPFASVEQMLSLLLSGERPMLGVSGSKGKGSGMPIARQSTGRAAGLPSLERLIDASLGLRGVAVPLNEAKALAEGAARVPLRDRLLAYRRREALNRGWVPEQGATDDALRASVLEATKDLSDKEIMKRLASLRGTLGRHLRRLPAIGARALAEGRPDLLADGSQILGFIPPREESREHRERPSPRQVHSEYFEDS